MFLRKMMEHRAPKIPVWVRTFKPFEIRFGIGKIQGCIGGPPRFGIWWHRGDNKFRTIINFGNQSN